LVQNTFTQHSSIYNNTALSNLCVKDLSRNKWRDFSQLFVQRTYTGFKKALFFGTWALGLKGHGGVVSPTSANDLSNDARLTRHLAAPLEPTFTVLADFEETCDMTPTTAEEITPVHSNRSRHALPTLCTQ
jgi:hypothetical protein